MHNFIRAAREYFAAQNDKAPPKKLKRQKLVGDKPATRKRPKRV
jgi:hypothetical protein